MNYNLDILSKNIDDAISHIKKTGNKALIRHHFKLNKHYEKYQSYILGKKDIIYLKFPKNNESFIGAGKSIKINVTCKEDYQETVKTLNKYKLFSNIRDDDCMCLGVLGFNISQKNSYPWDKLPNGEFTIPHIMLYKKNNEHFLVLTEAINKSSKREKIIENIKKDISKASNKKTIKIKAEKRTYEDISITNKDQYIKTIDKVIKKIKTTSLEKVIISKMNKYRASTPLDISDVIKHMNEKYNNCFNFIYQLNKNNFLIGSSPENLLRLKNNTVYTEAIAGTSKTKNNLDNEKEINEHSYVVDYFKNIFEKYCSKVETEKTKTLKLNYAYHLLTKIKGKLNKSRHILSIIKNIYPSPALLGYPSKKALKTIEENENFGRGLYGGSIGFFNIKGEGDFYVTIRSALVNKKNIYLFSGGGITEQSDSLKEWEETELKLQHIKSIIGLE